MSDLKGRVVAWANETLDEILRAPAMWGSREAVELQALLLLELRSFAVRPDLEAENPRRVLDAYNQFLREKFPKARGPLSTLLADEDGSFAQLLRDFSLRIGSRTLEENPFERSEIALRLTFEEGRGPSISAATGYYEEFRRTLRASLRAPSSRGGRPTKEVTQLTDFGFDDAVVTQPNGMRGSVLFQLGAPPGQGKLFDAGPLRAGLTDLLTTVEWADTTDDVQQLGVDDEQRRTHAALQARRLLPPSGVALVEIGGRFIARSKPVRLVPTLDSRLLSVVASSAQSQPFDKKGQVRAIDLDRGLLGLRIEKRERYDCHVERELLEQIAEVGVDAHVIGTLYTSGAQRFVLADSVELLADAPRSSS